MKLAIAKGLRELTSAVAPARPVLGEAFNVACEEPVLLVSFFFFFGGGVA